LFSQISHQSECKLTHTEDASESILEENTPNNILEPMSQEPLMNKKRVLVLRSNYLLSAGVECLLIEQKDLEVVSIDIECSTNPVEEFINVRPDVMVIDESTIITSLVSLVELFEIFPELRVIVVNLEKNHMSVFDKRHIPIQHLTDFYAAL
jgi:DNA polymerase elongation subunit (family B)